MLHINRVGICRTEPKQEVAYPHKNGLCPMSRPSRNVVVVSKQRAIEDTPSQTGIGIIEGLRIWSMHVNASICKLMGYPVVLCILSIIACHCCIWPPLALAWSFESLSGTNLTSLEMTKGSYIRQR